MRRSPRAAAGSGRRGRVAVAKALDVNAFALGDKKPHDVVAPNSVALLAETLRDCDARGEAVVLFGGGTLQGLGFAPARYDVAVSTTALRSVLEYEFADLTIAVEGGMTVADLEATLAAQGQFVPLDAPFASRSTVGGLLASGWYGPRRSDYGRPRDFVIGSGVVLADGTQAKAGGMVVKNVTGYDMSKLWCGSLGTLAAIVRANFKTLPLPAARRVALASLPERTRRRAIAHVMKLDLEPTVAIALRGFPEAGGHDGIDGRLFLMFEGSADTVERATRDLRSALGAAGVPETTLVDQGAAGAFARLLDAYVTRLGDRSVTYRSVGVPSGALERCETMARLAYAHDFTCETLLDLRSGDAYARAGTPLATELTERIEALDTVLRATLPRTSVLNAPEPERDRLEMWGRTPPSLDVMRAVKLRFDPKGTLAPGRFVGRI